MVAAGGVEFSGGGDPRRTIELLWGGSRQPRRGPRPRLTVAGIAAAAIRIADADGLAALSMRRLAEDLGVTAMSLYTYVPGKAELLDVMLDAVLGETPVPDPPPGSWRARLEQVAREQWARYHRHPWMLQVVTYRPTPGPNLIARYDWELRAVDGIGLTDVEMDLVVSLVGNYVHGAARESVAAAQAEQRTGVSDEQWWGALAPLLEEVLDPGRVPVAARVGAAAGAEYNAPSDPTRAFDFGLQRLLDGLERYLGSS